MARKWLYSIVTCAFAVLLAVPQVEAAGVRRISPNNPYRSFNITGINYGSNQWEREHGNRPNGQYRMIGRTYRQVYRRR